MRLLKQFALCSIALVALLAMTPGVLAQDSSNPPGTISMPPPIVHVAAGAYGAIAYSKDNGAWGVAAPSRSKDSAAKSALEFCNRHGAKCEIVDSFSNSCAAVAAGVGNNTMTWAHAETAPVARLKAENDCIKKSRDACDIKFWECYSDKPSGGEIGPQ